MESELEHLVVTDILDVYVEPAPQQPPERAHTKPRSRLAEDWREVQNPLNRTAHFKEVGNYLLGRLVDIRDNVGPNRSKMYDFEIQDGENPYPYTLSVWGGKSDLDGRLRRIKNPIGQYVYVELAELVPTDDPDRVWFRFLVKVRGPNVTQGRPQ
jgi:hypothetical protein